MLSSLAFALVWGPRMAFGRMKGVECISVRAMPVYATSSLAAFCLLIAVSGEDAIERFGRVTPWSVGVFVMSIAFAVFALLGLLLAIRHRKRQIRRLVWWHAFAASLVLSVVALYLAYWGLVGWMPWA
jgi:hypothetical protein